MKIQTTQSHRFGRKEILPFVGQIEISAEGTFEIKDEEAAKELVSLKIGFSEYRDVPDESDEVTSNELIEQLVNFKVSQLQDLAKPFPKVEWQSLKRDELINYLKGKL